MLGGHGNPSQIPELGGQKQDYQSKLWVQVRDRASVNKVERNLNLHVRVHVCMHTHVSTCIQTHTHTHHTPHTCAHMEVGEMAQWERALSVQTRGPEF